MEGTQTSLFPIQSPCFTVNLFSLSSILSFPFLSLSVFFRSLTFHYFSVCRSFSRFLLVTSSHSLFHLPIFYFYFWCLSSFPFFTVSSYYYFSSPWTSSLAISSITLSFVFLNTSSFLFLYLTFIPQFHSFYFLFLLRFLLSSFLLSLYEFCLVTFFLFFPFVFLLLIYLIHLSFSLLSSNHSFCFTCHFSFRIFVFLFLQWKGVNSDPFLNLPLAFFVFAFLL